MLFTNVFLPGVNRVLGLLVLAAANIGMASCDPVRSVVRSEAKTVAEEEVQEAGRATREQLRSLRRQSLAAGQQETEKLRQEMIVREQRMRAELAASLQQGTIELEAARAQVADLTNQRDTLLQQLRRAGWGIGLFCATLLICRPAARVFAVLALRWFAPTPRALAPFVAPAPLDQRARKERGHA